MKVLHVITGLEGGGAEAVLVGLCVSDTANTHRVVSLMDEGVYGAKLKEAGVEVRCAGMPRGRLTVTGLVRLWRFIRNFRPDVLQTWMYHGDFLGGLAGRLAGVRHIVWGIHNTELDREKSGRGTVLIAKACALLSGWIPERIAVCASKAAQVHEELGYAPEKMVVIPNGYDLACFSPDPDAGRDIRTEFSLSDDKPLLGMVARFDPFKDHGNLLSALEMLRTRGTDFYCLLVGGGVDSDNQELNDLISVSGLDNHVALLGPRNDVPSIMNALDIHVLSSSSEAFPNVVAEAMACGTPCVCTDVGDASLIIGSTGWVVESSQPEALATALADALEALHDSGRWSERRRDARSRIEEHFGISKMVSAYGRLWTEVAFGDRPPRA